MSQGKIRVVEVEIDVANTIYGWLVHFCDAVAITTLEAKQFEWTARDGSTHRALSLENVIPLEPWDGPYDQEEDDD